MIGKQTKGRGFRGLLNYLEASPGSQLIGGNMSGRNALELAREFKLSRQLNPEALKAVHHVSLSLAPGEKLDNDTWCEIAQKYILAMGYDCNQYAIYHHTQTEHDHIHIIASRIRLDNGKTTRDSWEYVRSEAIIRELEKEYGLQQTRGSREKLNRAPSSGQIRRMKREQEEYESGKRSIPPELPIKVQLQQAIDSVVQDHPPMPLMVARLQLMGIEVQAGFTRTGKSKGISFQMQGQAFSGTHLGPGYTFNGLAKKTDYQPERDDSRIQQLVANPNLAHQMLSRYLQQQQQQQQTQQRKSRGIER
ncbi:relaxase/mobilization nuclease domain-containing protein [Brasilonema sp. UFV-L1]|uniref:relaxase/mobilization nuclease domain-containing protein n=1 Tax=Brasilonema sp. UFV-L1 TaxID=2234130 RepID=UPI00145C4FD2|nr:relaxase/mobilization nuclease domain-containing protein [Brasilonema sp. UFV-L1]NMG09753.1 relaxase/mobilization nuclease [Brasilonema sp. UFV-L1]